MREFTLPIFPSIPAFKVAIDVFNFLSILPFRVFIEFPSLFETSLESSPNLMASF